MKDSEVSSHSLEHPAIEVIKCSIGYGDEMILHDISLEIPQGCITAIIGPNGSGKSTLMRGILGLIPIKYGKVRILGKHLHTMRQVIGYVPQYFNYDRDFPLTVREFLDLARHKHCPKSRIEEKIDEVGLSAPILDKNLGQLSGGQLQRVLIAQAILNKPQILFLDEPATGIDIVGEEAFYSIIRRLNKEYGTTIVLVSHDIAIVSSVVDNVICVNRKLMCSGPPATALTQDTLAALFGREASIYRHESHEHDHLH